MATDLNTFNPSPLPRGPLPQAVRASISIPGVFSPVQGRDGHYLVDGGILDNLPTDVLRNDLHADIIIAVRLEDAALSATPTPAPSSACSTAPSPPASHATSTQSQKLADVVINVPVGSFSGTDYSKAAQLIDAGYKAAEQKPRRPAALCPRRRRLEGLHCRAQRAGLCPRPASCAPSAWKATIRPPIPVLSAKSSAT